LRISRRAVDRVVRDGANCADHRVVPLTGTPDFRNNTLVTERMLEAMREVETLPIAFAPLELRCAT
jgi:hypothetical protein